MQGRSTVILRSLEFVLKNVEFVIIRAMLSPKSRNSKNDAMYTAVALLFFCHNLIIADAFKLCCHGKNFIVNGTCWDGSNLTTLSCDTKVLMSPSDDPPITIEIVETDDLLITDETGSLTVEPNKYCMTRESENGTDVALVCFDKEEVAPTKAKLTLFWIKIICAFITVAFLITTLIIYMFVPDLRDIEGKCILNFTASFCVAFLLILVLPLIQLIGGSPCDVTAFIFYTGTLCSVNWLSVISFHLWRITIRPIFQAHLEWFMVYFCYGYGVPLLLIITALTIHHTQNTELRSAADSQCIFDGNMAVWEYFYGPVMVMLLVSIVMQLWVAKKLFLDIDRRDHSPDIQRLRRKSLMYLHLLLVVGLGQILDMVSYIYYMFLITNQHLDNMWDLNDCRNLLIGGIVFFILVGLRNKVLKALGKRGLFCMKFPKKWEKLVDEESEEVESDEAVLTRDSTGL